VKRNERAVILDRLVPTGFESVTKPSQTFSFRSGVLPQSIATGDVGSVRVLAETPVPLRVMIFVVSVSPALKY
jgi:hypothetical protein